MVYPDNKTNDDKSNVIVGANQISKYENILQAQLRVDILFGRQNIYIISIESP